MCFTPSGLFLQCKEQYPHTQVGETVDGLTKHDDFVDFTLKPTIANDLDLSSADKIHTAWEGVVESYSGLSLTNADKDRLVALSGIAQEFSSALSPDTDNGREPASSYMDRELVSGLWRSTIVHRGLLWEQIKRGPHERIASIPTWSWASIVTRVRWPSNKHRNTVKKKRFDLWPVTIESNIELVNVLGGPQADCSESQPPILHIKARLQEVILGGPFPSRQDAEIVAHITSPSASSHSQSGLGAWQMVASPRNPSDVAGQASIEHPHFWTEDGQMIRPDKDSEKKVFALHVSQTTGVFGGITLGYLSPRHHVYNVVFVRRVEGDDGIIGEREGGNRYERIGAGRLFGREIDKGFTGGSMVDVYLV